MTFTRDNYNSISTKVCFGCGALKSLDEYPYNKYMADNRLNKCNECVRRYNRERYYSKTKDPEYLKKMRESAHDRYLIRRNNPQPPEEKEKIKKRVERFKAKYPEKIQAAYAAQVFKRSDGTENHHWSYNKEHHKDIIPLERKKHRKAHRFLIYDQEYMMYRTTDGELLYTKEKHLEYITYIIENEND